MNEAIRHVIAFTFIYSLYNMYAADTQWHNVHTNAETLNRP